MNPIEWLRHRIFTLHPLPPVAPVVDNGINLDEARAKLEETRRLKAEAEAVAYTSQTLRRQNHFSDRIGDAMRRMANGS